MTDRKNLEGHWAVFQGETTYLSTSSLSVREQLMLACTGKQKHSYILCALYALVPGCITKEIILTFT